MAFNWGASGAYGAVTHWETDMSWNGAPAPRRWHYLVYTYDGKTARIYDNTLEKGSRNLALQTAAGFSINLAVQNRADGQIQFVNEFDGSQQAGSLWIASVRILAGAQTPEQIVADFDREAKRFSATRPAAVAILQKGRETFTVGPFTLALLRATQTAASLAPQGASFDFLPADRLTTRLNDGYYHLGDCTLRTRTPGGAWNAFSSARERGDLTPVNAPGTLAASDLTAQLGADCPLTVIREWRNEAGHPVLRFRLTNRTRQPVEIGAFGAPMVFDNLLTGRSLEETHDRCVFADPSIGGPAGYLQVTRLN